MGMFGRYEGQGTGRALQSLRDCLAWNGPPENPLGELRSERALTQSKLASKAGISQSYLSEIESGTKRLSAPAAEKVSRALGVDPGVLLMSVRMGSLKTALQTGESRGPLAQEIVAVLALISENLPDGSLKNLLMATLVEALNEAVAKDKQQPAQQPQVAALKSKRNPSRDQWGRRVEEDAAEPRASLKSRDGLGRSRPKKDGVVRDAFGRNRSNRRPG
jgi:transcriptional regulator with XRE-family HTH domain